MVVGIPDLPVELLQRIASFTATCDSIFSLSRVNRRLREACLDDIVFKDWFKYRRDAIFNFALDYDPVDRSVWRRFALAETKADKEMREVDDFVTWAPQLLALHRKLLCILSLRKMLTSFKDPMMKQIPSFDALLHGMGSPSATNARVHAFCFAAYALSCEMPPNGEADAPSTSGTAQPTDVASSSSTPTAQGVKRTRADSNESDQNATKKVKSRIEDSYHERFPVSQDPEAYRLSNMRLRESSSNPLDFLSYRRGPLYSANPMEGASSYTSRSLNPNIVRLEDYVSIGDSGHRDFDAVHAVAIKALGLMILLHRSSDSKDLGSDKPCPIPRSALDIPFPTFMNLSLPFSRNSPALFNTCHLETMTSKEFLEDGEWCGMLSSPVDGAKPFLSIDPFSLTCSEETTTRIILNLQASPNHVLREADVDMSKLDGIAFIQCTFVRFPGRNNGGTLLWNAVYTPFGFVGRSEQNNSRIWLWKAAWAER